MFRICVVKLGRSFKQEEKLLRVLEMCRVLYNAALQERIEAWKKQGISISLYDQHKELTQIRAEDIEYENLPAIMVRETALNRLDKAFKGFFRRVKSGQKPGFPRYKGKDRFNTLVFGPGGWKIEGKKLIIKIKGDPIVFRMRNTIYRQGEIKGLKIIKSDGRWWAHFIVDIGSAPAVKNSKNGIGIDVGIRTFAVLSDGNKVEHPHFLRESLNKIKLAQKEKDRKKKGSNNRKKAKTRLQSVHAKIKNRRQNFIHQTVASLVKQYDGFAIEDLNVQQMLISEPKDSKRRLRQGIRDSGWSLFGSCLAAKAEEAGLPLVRVNPKGTTQKCSGCGSLVRKELKDRVHDCPACGLVLDRDENAARNIYDLGYRSVC